MAHSLLVPSGFSHGLPSCTAQARTPPCTASRVAVRPSCLTFSASSKIHLDHVFLIVKPSHTLRKTCSMPNAAHCLHSLTALGMKLSSSISCSFPPRSTGVLRHSLVSPPTPYVLLLFSSAAALWLLHIGENHPPIRSFDHIERQLFH